MTVATHPADTRQEHMPPGGEARALQRRGWKRFLLTLPAYAMAVFLIVLAAAFQLAEVWQAQILIGYILLGLGASGAILKSPAALRLRDPMLIYPQVLFAVGLISLSYSIMPVSRSVAMEGLCLVVLFDMQRLNWRQMSITAALAMILPAVGVMLVEYLRHGHIDIGSPLVSVLATAIEVPSLLMVAVTGRKLRGYLLTQRDQLTTATQQLHLLLMHDGLTGFYNRRHMQHLLDAEQRRFERSGRKFSLAFIDLDRFKQINDRFGHTVGDAVLQHFAALAQAAFPTQADALARWGGEEFLLLMPDTSQARAHGALMRFRRLVQEYDWSRIHPDLLVSFSAGVCESSENSSIAQLIDSADRAHYCAKRAGRDQVVSATPMNETDLALSLAIEQQPLASQQPDFSARNEMSQLIDIEIPAQPAQHPGKPAAAAKHAASRLSRLMLGDSPGGAEQLKLCLVASVNYLSVILVVLLYAQPRGLLSATAANVLVVLCLIGATVPYSLVRSGLTRNLKNPSLVMQQILWAGLGLMLGYGLTPDGHALVLECLCMTMVFSFIDLRPRAAVTTGICVIAMLGLTYLCLLVLNPPWFNPLAHGGELGTTAFVILLLTMQARNFARARAKLHRERLQLNSTQEKLVKLVTRDPLTGLFNRHYLQKLLERECERHLRSSHPFSVALLDLDHFKKVNDDYGHAVGDEALAGFAKAARDCLRDTDVLGRWGGEEFLMLLTDSGTGEQSLLAVERLREHVGTRHLCATAPEVVITVSAGVATHVVEEAAEELVDRADRALYQAKADGRNRSVLSPAPLSPKDERPSRRFQPSRRSVR